MENSYKYYVVVFQNDEISVIPASWLGENNNGSYYSHWPTTSKTLRTQIIRCTEPEESWSRYPILNIFGKYCTYEEAISAEKCAVASSESEGDRGPGKRKSKQKKNYEIDQPPTLPSSIQGNRTKVGSDVSKCAEVNNGSSFSNSSSADYNLDFFHNDDDNGDKTLTDKSLQNENNPTIIEIETTDIDMTMIWNKLLDIEIKMNLITQRLNEIEIPHHSTSDVQQFDKISKFIQVSSIEELLSLEELLSSDKDACKQLFYKFLQTSGKDPGNFLRRCLQVVVTNNLATLCSWTGQKNNFRVKDCCFVKVLKDSVRKPFPLFSDTEFEKTIMEWFRHAQQRVNRENRN